MGDSISRQAAISAICNACGKIDCDKMDKCEKLQLPPANGSETPNSSDTISRQAAIDALDRIFDNVPMELTTEILQLRRELRGLSSTDVAHVIHCRNCKYFRAHRCMDSMPIEICDLDQTFYDPDRDFCSLAESREG